MKFTVASDTAELTALSETLPPTWVKRSRKLTVPVGDWPKVVHNTIYGGGNSPYGLESRAVVLVTTNPQNSTNTLAESAGIFDANLLDAGAARGRRFIIDNY